MTENEFNELTVAVFARIEQMAGECGVAIRRTLSSSALKLEFADGQRIIISHDTRTHKIWLAARSGGIEYGYDNGRWLSSQDGSEIFAKLAELLNQLIKGSLLNSQPGKLVAIKHAVTSPSFSDEQMRSGPVKKIVLIGLLAGLGYFAFQHYSRSGVNESINIANDEASLSGSKCDAVLPGNGTTHIFPASNIRQDSPGNTDVTVQNDHSHPLMATFTAPKTIIPYLSVLVYAGQTAQIGLPAGQYDLLFSVGNSWCNSLTGFADGSLIKLSTTLSVLPLQPVQMIAQSSGAGAADFQMLIKSSAPAAEPPAFQFVGNGVMEIRQHSDGHYHISGAINGAPATYIIDTGASLTSLSPETARRAGIVDCKPSIFKTANGTITGCVAPVAQLTIGSYQMQNVNVAVMPNMEVNLLGMNVLSHFSMTQANGVMRLSSH